MRVVVSVSTLLGFVGAAMSYASRIGFDLESSYLCPVCPHVTMLNVHPVLNFAGLTIVMGTLNSLIFSAVGCGVWALLTRTRQFGSQPDPRDGNRKWLRLTR